MSDKQQYNSSFKELMIAIPGTILGFTLLVSILASCVKPSTDATVAESSKAEVTKVDENVKPVATVEVAAAETGPHVDKTGEEVVNGVCVACHAAGALGSPKIGDASQWGPRIAQGYETLVKHAIEGIRSMPARGGNADLTDGEIANAVAFMANKAGAKFDPASLKK